MAPLEYFKGYLTTVKTWEKPTQLYHVYWQSNHIQAHHREDSISGKPWSVFTDEQKAAIGWYAAEHSNTGGVNRMQLPIEIQVHMKKKIQALKIA